MFALFAVFLGILMILLVVFIVWGMMQSVKVIHESFDVEPCSFKLFLKNKKYVFSSSREPDRDFPDYKSFETYFRSHYTDCDPPTISSTACTTPPPDVGEDVLIPRNTVIEPPENEFFSSDDDCEEEEEEEEEDCEEVPEPKSSGYKPPTPRKDPNADAIRRETTPTKAEWGYEPDPRILSPYGFSYMPPSLWSVPQQRPPVCIPQTKTTPTPVFTNSSYTDVMEFTGLGTIMPRFQYQETTNYDVDQLKKMANKTIFNSNYLYPGYFTNSPQKIEDLI